nr:YcxB family protein [Shewanella intestini]
MSKAAGNPVNLTIDETGITTKSDFVNQQLKWQDISEIIETDVGFTLTVNQQKNYLSKRTLDDAACAYVRAHMNP